MQIPVNKDLDSYRDDFFKGLTLKQTALSIVSIASGTGAFLFGTYVLRLEQSVSFYLALPVVLPIAASGFLRIYGMTPMEYLKKRHGTIRHDRYRFVPDALVLDERKREKTGERAKTERHFLDDDEGEVI